MIPYGRQHILEEDIKAVEKVLRSDFLTQGETVPAFESAVSSLVGAKYAAAVNSATSALHIACLALGVGPGDRVWTVPNTFVASANCALYCGATVDFIDIDPETYNLSVSALEQKLELAKKNGGLPKVLIPVHFAGQSCDMEAIHRLCNQYEVKIIEDASHSIGSTYQGKYVGNCQYSDITVYSFHPVKIITSGEGGMALTNNEELIHKLRKFRCHGIEREVIHLENKQMPSWFFEQQDLGYNYRLTDIHAALGLSQLNSLGYFISKRREIAAYYDKEFSSLPVKLPFQNNNQESSYHLYVLRISKEVSGIARDEAYDRLREVGVYTNIHYIPVHLHPYYKKLGFQKGDFPVCESYFGEALSIPIFPRMTREEQETVVEQVGNLFN